VGKFVIYTVAIIWMLLCLCNWENPWQGKGIPYYV
jgi:hypothetical protein